MCCFSRPVPFVGGTRVFARGLADGSQALVYAMDVELAEPLAMVLPLPVPEAPGEDAVRFVDLSAYPRFFDDLDAAFPPDYATMPQAKGPVRRNAPPAQTLAVHAVGDFVASFVPTRADFARLDPRFRLPERVWDALPAYADYGFVVCELAPKKRGLFGSASRQRVHPMAFTFPRREQDALFFPTLHVHDGEVTPTARFDHMLFCQTDGVLDATLGWMRSDGALGARMDTTRALGILDGERDARRASLFGELDNGDVVLRAPEGVTVDALSGGGETFTFRARATAAYAHGPLDAQRAVWRTTARMRLPALVRALHEDLPALLSDRREAWALARRSEDLPAHFLNGYALWRGTSYLDGAPATAGGPGRVAFRIFTPRAEPQDVELAFARLPDQRALDAIRTTLEALIDRAVA